MQGICTYIPETNYVPREYSVAAVLLLLFMVLISLVPLLIIIIIHFCAVFRLLKSYTLALSGSYFVFYL